MFYDYEFKHYNIRLILYMTALNILGILVIRSATNLNETMVSKQILGVLIGMAVAVGLSLVDYHRILNLSAVIYIICFLSLVAVLVWGKEVNNAKRWIEVPVIGQLQPSEFVKIGLIIFFSWYFMKYQERINQPSVIGAAALLFALPAYLVFDQPNLSTSLVMVIMVAGIVFASGISYRWIAGTLAVVLPVTGTFIYLLLNGLIPFIREYQAGRILAWFNPEKYGQAYYQQANSIIAIGSGQLNGKGLYNTTIASVKNGNFLSEEQTDFIFAVIGEELGFIGCMAVIILLFIDHIRMPDYGGPGKGPGRTSDLRRNGHADRVPGICQHRRRHGNFPQHGPAAAVYQFWQQFPHQYLHRDGAGSQRWTAARNTTLATVHKQVLKY